MKVVIFILIIMVVYFFILYNLLIKRKNKIKQAKSTIDVYLTQRFDLIPNLVECVKAYNKYELNTLEKIAELRTNYMNTKDLKQGEILNKEMNDIILNVENYPELKASEQFLILQKSLIKMENRLQAARRIYNHEVSQYNIIISVFPNNLFANIFNLKKEILFEAEELKTNNINVKKIINK